MWLAEPLYSDSCRVQGKHELDGNVGDQIISRPSPESASEPSLCVEQQRRVWRHKAGQNTILGGGGAGGAGCNPN